MADALSVMRNAMELRAAESTINYRQRTINMENYENYVDAAASVAELAIDPAHRPGVLANFERIARLAALIMEFPLDEHVEAAPMFKP
jgi:pterin-4a-carbinolamine dehydratase